MRRVSQRLKRVNDTIGLTPKPTDARPMTNVRHANASPLDDREAGADVHAAVVASAVEVVGGDLAVGFHGHTQGAFPHTLVPAQAAHGSC